MPTEPFIQLSTVVAFVLVLARVASIFAVLPMPASAATPGPARVIAVVAITLTLAPQWPFIETAEMTLGKLVVFILAEVAYGIMIGVAVSCVLEAFVLGCQLIGLQAGFTYASTIDPTTNADSTALLVIAQLTSGLIFFAFGLDRQVLLAFAHSLQTHPPGTLSFSAGAGAELIQLTGGIFSTGFKLVLPVLALLLMLDVSLGLLGRLNSQLQVITLAFPVKIIALLTFIGFSVLLMPRALMPFVETCFRFIARHT